MKNIDNTHVKSADLNMTNQLQYDAKLSRLYYIWITNFLLTIVTLGIYSFWGKTRMRRYIIKCFTLLKDRFEYSGTGFELFLGFLKAMLFLILFYLFSILLVFTLSPIFGLISSEEPTMMLILMAVSIILLVFYLLFIFSLVFVAYYAAWRYRFSRTTWRGIRGRLTGSAFKFALKYVGRLILNIISLGLLIPASDKKISNYLLNNCYFGDAKLNFSISDQNASSKPQKQEPLFIINLVTLLLAVPTLMMSRFWYAAALTRFVCANTQINNLHFQSTFTGWGLLKLNLINLLIFIFTLGFGTPIIVNRKLKYFAKNTYILGDIETANIKQSDEKLGSSGEGLAQAFDLDTGIM